MLSPTGPHWRRDHFNRLRAKLQRLHAKLGMRRFRKSERRRAIEVEMVHTLRLGDLVSWPGFGRKLNERPYRLGPFKVTKKTGRYSVHLGHHEGVRVRGLVLLATAGDP